MEKAYFVDKELLIHAITGKCRYVSEFCRYIGISRQRFYDWINRVHIDNGEASITLEKILHGLERLYNPEEAWPQQLNYTYWKSKLVVYTEENKR